MLLSIVIITLNEEHNLKRLLEQLRRQTYQDVEIVVADAGSQDHTRAVARAFGVQVVEGGLPSHGRNAGAAATHAHLLLFLDADTQLIEQTFLEDMVHEMQRRQLDIAGVGLRADSTDWIERFGFWAYSKYARLCGAWFPHAAGACLFVKRHIHESIGGFDETVTLAEDMVYARLASNLGTFGILKTHRVITSPRRLRKEGRLALLVKLVRAELHLVFRGPIRHHHIPWDFDHTE